jgi:hypothetical protein
MTLAACLGRWLTAFGRQAEDSEIGTDHFTQITFHTEFGLEHFGVVITLLVELGGHLEHAARTELHAELAPFAAINDQVDFAVGNLDFVDIEGNSPIAHGLVLSRAITG